MTLPAKQKPAAVAVQSGGLASFDKLVRRADGVVTCYKELSVFDVAQKWTPAALAKAGSALNYFYASGCRAGMKSLCDALYALDEDYDDNGVITRAQVSKHISLLVGSFPAGAPADPEVYTRMLIEEVLATEPSVIELESACRELRRTVKFLPTISEALAALTSSKTQWSERWIAIDCVEDIAEELKAVVEKAGAESCAPERCNVTSSNGSASVNS